MHAHVEQHQISKKINILSRSAKVLPVLYIFSLVLVHLIIVQCLLYLFHISDI